MKSDTNASIIEKKYIQKKSEYGGTVKGKLRITTPTEYKNGQVAKMNKLVKQVIGVASFGVFWLVMAIGSSMNMAREQAAQLDVTMALNQYRLGSKALNAAVQAYSASGGEDYYNAYMQELRTKPWKT